MKNSNSEKSLQALRQELLEMRFEHAVGKLLNSSSMKAKRREIARALTAAANAKKNEAK